MILLNHVLLYALAAMVKGEDYESRLANNIQWLLLPDALEELGCPHEMIHFMKDKTGTDTAWLEFPMGETLKGMDQSNWQDSLLKFHFDGEYADCVLGNKIDLSMFDQKNYSHPNFGALRIHMLQDAIQEEVLCRGYVDVSGRYKNRYVLRSNPLMVLDSQYMKDEMKRFEEQGFLHLVGKAYRMTGVLFNQNWFDKYVGNALFDSYYPENMWNFEFNHFQISSAIEDKINHYSFDFEFNGDCHGILGIYDMGKLESLYDELYSYALLETLKSM